MRARSLLVALLMLPLLAAGAADDGPLAEADALYAAGDYLRAAALYDELARSGNTDGTVLYKLFFCQRQTGDPGAAQALQRATEQLEKDAAGSKRLETHFYLVNAYSSAGRTSEAAAASARATELLEKEEIPAPTEWEGMFRVGKLYADQNETARAMEWYEKSVVAHEASGAPPSPYVPWARRYIVDRAMASGELARAEKHLTPLTEGEPNGEDLDRLAVLRVRLKKYGEAVKAWRQAERLNPTDANRPRYCWRLAQMAADLGELPDQAADGRAWTALSREELETTLTEQAAVVGETVAAALEQDPLDPPARQKLQSRVDGAKPLFVAAALEYAVRGLPIRQTAFFGGYAPLIFRPTEWNVQAAVRRRATSDR